MHRSFTQSLVFPSLTSPNARLSLYQIFPTKVRLVYCGMRGYPNDLFLIWFSLQRPYFQTRSITRFWRWDFNISSFEDTLQPITTPHSRCLPCEHLMLSWCMCQKLKKKKKDIGTLPPIRLRLDLAFLNFSTSKLSLFRIQSRVWYWIGMLGVPNVLWPVTFFVFPYFSWSWQSWGIMTRYTVRMSSMWCVTVFLFHG